MPANTFSLTACSRNPSGASTGTLPEATSSAETIPRAPPKWSTWLWVYSSPVTGRSPRCSRYSASAAAAVSQLINGSITSTPRWPSTIVMFERSSPRTW